MISIPEAIRRYHGAGLRPIALWGLLASGKCACERPDCENSRGKHPIEPNWQRLPSKLDYLLETVHHVTCNVGLAMGIQPRGDFLIAVDCDGPDELLEQLQVKANCKLPPTLTSLTRKGTHRIYSVSDGVVIGNRAKLLKAPKGSPDIDIRGEGGQIVAPPSLHYSGHQYRWANCLTIAPLPDAFTDWLTEPVAPTRPAPIPCASRNVYEAFERAQKYVKRCEPAISGNAGHQTTFKTCIKLIGTFPELSDAQLWSLLVDYNATCQPPWSERDLKHKLQDALRVSGRCAT
jgi:hypothetical protein